ncbi:hypothetical protein HY490_02585 [Candidatus Woesearchaeota archaeon]|nr:hypothetical protein [Candidatus Woesearchaeota archaeon]
MGLERLLPVVFTGVVTVSGCYVITQRPDNHRGLELLGDGESIKAPSPSEEFVLSREEFYEFLRRPVQESLRDTRVQFVTMAQYDAAVAQADVRPEQRRPVMAMVYFNSPGSRGLAALMHTWDRQYPDLKQIAMCFSESETPAQSVVDDTYRRFSLRGLPGLIAYSNNGGRIERVDQADGGFSSYSNDEDPACYLANISVFRSFIEEQLLLR